MRKLDAFQLKVFALILMLMDHAYFAFPDMFPLWFHILSRVVSPIFAFLVVEGLFHTSNKFKYNIRLFYWAIFMELGNIILNIVLKSKDIGVYNNIFLTLALGLTIINIFEYSKSKSIYKRSLLIILAILLIPLSIFTEGGTILIPFTIITYIFRKKTIKLIIGYIILSVILFCQSYVQYPTIKETIDMLMFNSDFLFIAVIPFIFMYNGQRGMNNKFSKYLFYLFYPLHLWILAILQYILK